MTDRDDRGDDLGRVQGRLITASKRREAAAVRPTRVRLFIGDEAVGTAGGVSESVEGHREVVDDAEWEADFGDYERELEMQLEGDEQPRGETEATRTAVGTTETRVGDVASSSSRVRVRRGPRGRFERSTEAEGSTSVPLTDPGAPSTSRGTRAREDSWVLRTVPAGGPQLFDVIPSFGGHVSLDLFADPDSGRGVLRAWTRHQALHFLRERWVLSAEMFASVEASGLIHLSACLPTHLDMPLLSAFIERWQPDTNSFHMPFGEMTIMLHDVEEILMLPTEGRVCSGDIGSGMEDMMELFMMTREQMLAPFAIGRPHLSKHGAVHIEGILSLLSGAGVGADRQAQAYLLYLIGSTLFTDKTGDRVRSTYFSLLRDVERVHEYAWGAGTLAYLYRSLGVASRADCRGVDGCLALLQCWIYEYFPTLRPTSGMLIPRAEVPERQPRCLFWESRGTRRVSDDRALRDIRLTLDQLTPDRVNWCPYGPLPFATYPRTLFRGVIRFLDIMEPYHPDRCLRQLGFVQSIPQMMFRPDDAYRGKVSSKYKVKYVGRVYDDCWDMLVTNALILDDRFTIAVPASRSAPGYLDWYLPRTHPFIIDPARHDVPLAHDRAHVLAAVGHRVVDTFLPFYQGLPLDQVWERVQSLIGDVGPDVYRYYGIEGVPQWPPAAEDPEAEQSLTDSRRRRGGGSRGGGGGRARRG